MRTKQTVILGIVLLTLFTGSTYWFLSDRSKNGRPLLKPSDTRIVATGNEIYAAQCASCHGASLEGQPDWKSPGADGLMPAPPHDETGHTWHHPDEVLFNITKLGVVKAAGLTNYESAMPAYEELLSDEEIVAVLSYIKSRWPESIRTRHDEMNERYAKEPKS